MNINIKSGPVRTLRHALVANALFSGLSGAAIVLLEPVVLAWLGLEGVKIWPAGGLLIGFALYLLWMANSQKVPVMLVKGVTASDWAWVMLSVALLLLKATAFSGFGVFLILDVALVVMVFALRQGRALRRYAPG